MTTRAPSVEEVLGPDGLLARAHPAWEHRSAQLEMAEAIRARIESGGILAVEAPTGVGKTLAYLVPAILSGRRVIVSTNTKTLQDQIVLKDLPFLARAFESANVSLVRSEPEQGPPIPGLVRYSLMKGRANYLCLHRLDKHRSQLGLPFGGSRSHLDQIAGWARTTVRGDRAELIHLGEDLPIFSELDARSDICIGSRCPRFEDCFVVRMRREAEAAELIVVNHHLLLADLAMTMDPSGAPLDNFGRVLPRADVLILDEAHTLEEIASDYFGGEVSSQRLHRLAKDALSFSDENGVHALQGAVADVIEATTGVFDSLPSGDGRIRISSSGRSHSDAKSKLASASAALLALAERVEAEPDPWAQSIATRAKAIEASLRFVLEAADPDFVYWSERGALVRRLGAAPIEVKAALERTLFRAYPSVVLASATLSTGKEDRLEYFLGRIGAPPTTQSLLLGTPFDFPSQAALYIPARIPPPDSSEHAEALAKVGEELIRDLDGGAFFLFTSHRMMKRVHERIGHRLPYPVLIQGEAPKAELLRQFVERAPAVLFATSSFWEGVDVPGDPLRLVIIDRLPFQSPSDPLCAARVERAERLGESAFQSYQVPHAILRLKQAFGRLIRTKSDRGVVAILDGRVRQKSYGKRFVDALPETVRLSDREDLLRWWHNP